MWLRVMILVLAGLTASAWATAQQLKLIEGAPEVYTVKKGDTLWDISAHFLSNPWLWPELWQVNDYIKNPHLIYPGDQLHLIWVDGQPRLSLKKRIHLSPQARVIRAPITTLQSSLMMPYLAQDKLMTPQHLERLPRVLGESNARDFMTQGDTVWVDSELETGDEWWIYRPDMVFERDLEDGESREVKVMTMKEIARGTVAGTEDKMSALTLTTLGYEVRQNDVLLPAPLPSEQLNLSFSPSEPPAELNAKILGHFSGINFIATHETVVIDHGHLDGVAAGHVFQLFRAGVDVVGRKGDYEYQKLGSQKNFTLHQIPVGEIVVIRPYEHFSIAVITKSSEPVAPGTLALPPKTNG